MLSHAQTWSSRIRPVGVWLSILALIFAAEYGVMLLLTLLPQQPPRWLEAAADAVVLTLLLAPVMWWMVVRPLRQAMRLQSLYLERLLAGVEAERRRLAHELHDGVGQSLTLLVSGLRSWRAEVEDPNSCRRSQDLERLAQTALKDTRKLALGLRPSLLDDLGLAPAIERVIADVRENHPLDIKVDVAALADRRLPETVETAIFRVFQEAINNIMKHSGARHAAVRLGSEDGMITLEMKDDGCGIPPERLQGPADDHLGLIGMRERTALLGGELSIDAMPGRGTRIVARIPERGTA